MRVELVDDRLILTANQPHEGYALVALAGQFETADFQPLIVDTMNRLMGERLKKGKDDCR